MDETKIARDEIIVQSKDSEKRLQTLEAELLQLTEVNYTSYCISKLEPHGYRQNALSLVMNTWCALCLSGAVCV